MCSLVAVQLQECPSFKGCASCLQVGVLVSEWCQGPLRLRLHGSLSRMQWLHSAALICGEVTGGAKLLVQKLVMGSNLLCCKIDTRLCVFVQSRVTCEWCVEKFVLLAGPNGVCLCGLPCGPRAAAASLAPACFCVAATSMWNPEPARVDWTVKCGPALRHLSARCCSCQLLNSLGSSGAKCVSLQGKQWLPNVWCSFFFQTWQ